MYGRLMRHGKPVRHPMNRTIRLFRLFGNDAGNNIPHCRQYAIAH